MRRAVALALGLLLGFPAFGQTPGAINLVGPSTVPGAPQLTPLAINNAVNPALGLKADATNPVISGTLGVTGAATFSGNLSVNGILTHHPGTQAVGSAAVVPVFDFATGFTGTATGNPTFVYSGMKLVISPDTLALPNANQFFNGFQLQHNFGGTGMSGNRQAVQLNLVQAGAIAASAGTSGFYVTQQNYAQMSFSAGGTGLTSGTALGRAFSGAFSTQMKSGATNFYQATGVEIDVSIASGASAAIRSWLSVAALSGPVQGSLVDAGVWMYSAGGAALLKTGILIGSGAGLNNFPIDPAGAYIADDTSGSVTATAAYGLHFTGAFSTASIAVPGFTVDGSGNVAIGGTLGVTGATTLSGTIGVTGAGTFSASGTGLTVSHQMLVSGLATLTGGFTATASNVVGTISGADSALKLGAGSTHTYSGAASDAQDSFLAEHILRGTVASGSQSYAKFWIPDDGAVAPASNGQIAVVSIIDTLTANALGNRWGLDVGMANSAALSGAAALGGVRAQVTPAFNMGGSGTAFGTSLGSNFGANITAHATGTATNLRTVTGQEIDVSIATGASSYAKVGLAVVLLSDDAVQGAVWDYGISVQSQVAQASGVGFQTGLVFGGNGGFGVAATGTLIGSAVGVGGMLAGIGIDFSGVTFSVTPIKLPALTNAANDAAAAGAGIPIGGFYRNGSIVMQRIVLNDNQIMERVA